MRVYICSLLAVFLGGLAIGLLISYPIPGETIVVCFWAVILMMWASVMGVWAVIEWSVARSKVKVDHLVEVMVNEMIDERSLRLVDRDRD